MNKYNPLYYLLFVLLITGAFAAMAQNDYGSTILGFVAISFCVLFAAQFVTGYVLKRKLDLPDAIELVSLVILTAMISLRIFYISVVFTQIIYMMAGLVLVVLYTRKLIICFRSQGEKKGILAYGFVLFLGSILLYLFSMTVVSLSAIAAGVTGTIAFVISLVFVGVAIFTRKAVVGEGKTMAYTVAQFRDKSVVLFVFFFLSTTYITLTKFDLLPKMYSDKYPAAFFNLVAKGDTGKGTHANDTYSHETFRKAYDKVVARHSDKNN